jgi:hypothetical protein
MSLNDKHTYIQDEQKCSERFQKLILQNLRLLY